MKRTMDTMEAGGMGMAIPVAAPTFANVLCCECGASIQPNPSMMCAHCLRQRVDIAEGISKQVVLPWCQECNRYMKPPWVRCELESKELLALCLKKIKGLQKVKLVDANFIWTEPHSRRLKVKCTIQKEVVNGAIMQQSFTVEFVVTNHQCDDCKRTYTPHTWNACVQTRQRTDHKRTFLWLEQLIMKHEAHDRVLNIVEKPDGVDFQFANKSHAQKFADFVASFFPTKSKTSKQLISHDSKSNTYFHKYTIYQEVCPVCKDDLVYIPPKVAAAYGGIPNLMVCYKVSTAIHLIDPLTSHCVEIPCVNYWKQPFQSVYRRRHMSDFVVLDVEEVPTTTSGGVTQSAAAAAASQKAKKGQAPRKHKSKKLQEKARKEDALFEGGAASVMGDGEDVDMGDGSALMMHGLPSGPVSMSIVGPAPSVTTDAVHRPKFRLADVEIARVSDLGQNDERLTVRTHLGGLLKPGDTCQGFDLRTLNMSGVDTDITESQALGQLVDVVLVKKTFPSRSRKGPRKWVLRELPKDQEEGVREAERARYVKDVEEFKRDLEEDPEMRREINLYRDPNYRPPVADVAEMGDAGQQFGGASASGAAPVAGEGEEDDPDFPDVRLDELLDGLASLTIEEGENVQQQQQAGAAPPQGIFGPPPGGQ
uniref:60S ribosomal export protein NMD3 n=1 Tax=Chromera velia CCMP2878 TaxID=1169474 RepID=A0A0G4H9Y5_9ALVE|mmetsp:Transcript_2168/g.4572  ORF Transcript_2168/g.4572 Transcript_2168/m.4572 type:complete len:650 (+) Transcript_2168:151-2100(+)|eukprot:Cvel_25509.t1-p1 / transcript=Cvel_25509.t1 / gene=Cvel_25509 / organism=Chromera_velia_CCMP2878 / gene_product=60S ribosomal export protein NMD3, putative / transcript_product=60S ribosomal export protein NMD3, putative / location=Cvel_scaffold2902:13458-17379(+) / protein_length=649 / sequence_SO=supercontig / SO=protein_coding / is_pseudo=false